MTPFLIQDGEMFAEGVAVHEIAEAHGTPCYVYSRAMLEHQWRALDRAFGEYPHLICYAVKANSNLRVLKILSDLGSGFDIVSGGELQRVLRAGGDPNKVVFSGVGKSEGEIQLALECGESGVRCLNIESTAELERIQSIARRLGRIANIGIRVNPDVDARTHPYIATGLQTSKFGLDIETAVETYRLATAMSHVRVHSMACHIGSQITDLEPFADAVERVAATVQRLHELDIDLQQLDLGGGLGIDYQGEQVPSADAYIQNLLAQLAKQGIKLPVAIEPGRYIAGPSGILVTRVEYLKTTPNKAFAVVDTGMNDLMRPALYQAYHRVEPVRQGSAGTGQWDIVGPVCESADVLGTNRELAVAAGDLLAIKAAGAYAYVMASNYNSRPRPPEILVDGLLVEVIRKRETYEDLWRGETV